MSLYEMTLKSTICLLACAAMVFGGQTDRDKPFVIKLNIPAPEDSAGGIIVADADDDGKMDYLVTVPGHLAVYGSDGRKLWIKKIDIMVGGSSERYGLPGHNGPGVAAGDVDGDGKCEVV
ncbi:MAG: FG-GAP repeat domain-containing protein, partial [Planctomycetota bacterium]